MRKGSSTKIKGEDVGKGNGEMVGRRYHCFMEGLFDFVDATALWKDIRFTLERGIYAILSEGNNNNNNTHRYSTNRYSIHQLVDRPTGVLDTW